MKMKLIKNKKYLQQKISQKVLVPKTSAGFTSKVSKSHVPFACRFAMVMHILHKRCRSKTNFHDCIYDKISEKCSASFRIHGEIPKNPLSELCEKRNRSVRMSCMVR